MKICSKCKVPKGSGEFHRQKNHLQSRCKKCVKLSDRTRYLSQKELLKAQATARNLACPGRAIANARKRIYGVSPEQFVLMVEKQGNKCAICQRTFSKTPCVDHNHITKKIRGVLCGACNRGLGLLGDCIERISAALTYLKQYET